MRPLRFLRRNPLVVLAAFVTAFAVWVWRDALPDDPSATRTPMVLNRPLPSLVMTDAADALPPKSQVTAQALPKLKPGMTRTEVEGLVGAPAADDISPATVADGRVTYRMSYEADLAPAGTVRPIRQPRVSERPAPVARTLVTLEFDATKPGHPLLGVHYPDPLF